MKAEQARPSHDEDQLRCILTALDEERKRANKQEEQIKLLQRDNQKLSDYSHKLRIEYANKSQEIEQMLISLVQQMNPDN